MTPEPTVATAGQFAAIDLGSNSFHLVVARRSEDGMLTVVDRLKVGVRLAAGLTADQTLSPEAAERALACLARFGERIGDIPTAHVRAVGTNTLRKARDSSDFLAKAEDALGHSIDIITGREEARLIFRGVVRDVEADGRLLVIDIGGGSTELIVGEGDATIRLDSLFMGCVSWSARFFGDGRVTEEQFNRAVIAARRELQGVVRAYRRLGWSHVVGSSGTVNAIERILQANGFAGIDRKALDWLSRKIIKVEHVSQLDLTGLSEDRRPVIAGGVAILVGLFVGLRLKGMVATRNALREGVLLELVGRERQVDIRELTVSRLMDRFDVDRLQAARVEHTALELFDQVRQEWKLRPKDRLRLGWAASLHEMGMFLTYAGYHKHGAYLLSYNEMPGFSRQEQCRLAAMLLGHRGRLSRSRLEDVAVRVDGRLIRSLVLLRLAARIHRRRSPKPPPAVELTVEGKELRLAFPDRWLEERPLSRGDLLEDAQEIANLGFGLEIA